MCVGGIRTSTTATSGRRSCTREKGIGLTDPGDDFDAVLGEQAREPLADERRVVGDHYSHGNSARMVVPWAAVDRERRVERLEAIVKARKAGACSDDGAAASVV